MTAVQLHRVVEPELEYGRRPAAIFGRAHDDDDVGRVGVVEQGLAVDAD